MRFLPLLASVLLLPLLSQAATPVSVTVSAAASLADVTKAACQVYATVHPDVELVFNYGGSGALQKQIENGAPVDAFISAAVEPMQALTKAALVGPARNVAGNALVVAAPPGLPPIASAADLDRADIRKIAIGDPASVPAGQYARQALTKLGLWDKLQPKFVFTKDVRQAATYVAQGNAEAAFIYRTDLPAQGAVVAWTVPDDLHLPIVYPAAVLTKAAHPQEAQAFLDFLSGPEGQALFKKFGFTSAAQ